MRDNKETTPLLEEQGTQFTPQQLHMLQLIVTEQQQLQKQYHLRQQKLELERQQNIQEPLQKDKSNKKSIIDQYEVKIIVTIIVLLIFIGLGIYAGIKSN